MTSRRLTASSVFLAIIMAAASPGSAAAAVQEIILSSEQAAPGASVSIRIEMSARIEGTQPGTLYLIPQTAFDEGPFNRHCAQVPGTVDLVDLAWRQQTVDISEWSGDGYVAESSFTVPQVSTGAYYLGEAIPARGTGCHVFRSFGVTASGLPDTAVRAASGAEAH